MRTLTHTICPSLLRIRLFMSAVCHCFLCHRCCAGPVLAAAGIAAHAEPREMFLMEAQEGCPGRKHVLTKQRILDYVPHLDSNILKLEGTDFYLPMCHDCNNTMSALGACAAVKCTRCTVHAGYVRVRAEQQ
jgi:hypothetical protein